MALTLGIFTFLILLFNFGISIWNAYASGMNIGLARRLKIEGFQKWASYAGLGLAYVGMTYVLVIVLSLIADSLGYISDTTAMTALAFNFLVFGIMIIGFGLIITIQSIIIAWQRRNFWSIAIALYNTIAEIWDIAIYASMFNQTTQMLRGSSGKDRQNAAIIILLAMLVAFFVVHAAYKHGLDKAEDTDLRGLRQQNVRSKRI